MLQRAHLDGLSGLVWAVHFQIDLGAEEVPAIGNTGQEAEDTSY
jgi:hypothetical protein